jgi:hypothetical protein
MRLLRRARAGAERGRGSGSAACGGRFERPSIGRAAGGARRPRARPVVVLRATGRSGRGAAAWPRDGAGDGREASPASLYRLSPATAPAPCTASRASTAMARDVLLVPLMMFGVCGAIIRWCYASCCVGCSRGSLWETGARGLANATARLIEGRGRAREPAAGARAARAASERSQIAARPARVAAAPAGRGVDRGFVLLVCARAGRCCAALRTVLRSARARPRCSGGRDVGGRRCGGRCASCRFCISDQDQDKAGGRRLSPPTRRAEHTSSCPRQQLAVRCPPRRGRFVSTARRPCTWRGPARPFGLPLQGRAVAEAPLQ